MTRLRKMMLEELQRRNYAETTISSYIRIVEDFSRRFQRPPDCLGPKHFVNTNQNFSRSASWRQAR
jgi:integrase/recombinase XerD